MCTVLFVMDAAGMCRLQRSSFLNDTVVFWFGGFLFVWFSFLFYIGVELINNDVLVTGVQQSDSVIPHTSILFFKFFSLLGYYRILSKVPCAIQ